MFKRYLLLNLLEDGGTGGGGAPTPPAGTPPAATPPAGTPPAATPPAGTPPTPPTLENWKDALPDELKNDPSIKSLKDIQALAKSYIHGQKLVGKDKIVVPDNLTSEEEWGKIYQKLGMPESVEKYEFKVPEGTTPEFMKGFKEVALKAGILPKAAEKMFEFFDSNARTMLQKEEDNQKAQHAKVVDSLKRDWGQAYDRKLANASGLFNQYADQETKDFMKATGFGNNPTVLKMMAKIADSFGEDKFVAPGGNGDLGITPAEAQEKIKSLYANPNHAYFHKAHPEHAAAKAEVATWHAAVLAGKKR